MGGAVVCGGTLSKLHWMLSMLLLLLGGGGAVALLGVSTPGEDFLGGKGGATTAAPVDCVPGSWRFCKMAYELELEALSLALLLLLEFWGNFWP